MYIRKTKDKFFIENKYGFDGKFIRLPINFETEKECNKKLKELNDKVEYSQNNLILDPFGWLNYYRKIKKRIKI